MLRDGLLWGNREPGRQEKPFILPIVAFPMPGRPPFPIPYGDSRLERTLHQDRPKPHFPDGRYGFVFSGYRVPGAIFRGSDPLEWTGCWVSRTEGGGHLKCVFEVGRLCGRLALRSLRLTSRRGAAS